MKKRIDEFVLGSMTPDERAAMEQARRHDPELDQGIRDVEDSMAALSLTAGELAPPRGLWKRIKAAISDEREALEDRLIMPLGEGDWQPVAPGIDFKVMWNNSTTLLRCAPGAVLPDHMHDDEEHLLVLSGDLIIGGRAFSGGDYIGSRKGFDRFPHSTRMGCLILCQIRE
jgi:mannose-6-phosphate isomerase-like protein (cupin superfamily)